MCLFSWMLLLFHLLARVDGRGLPAKTGNVDEPEKHNDVSPSARVADKVFAVSSPRLRPPLHPAAQKSHNLDNWSNYGMQKNKNNAEVDSHVTLHCHTIAATTTTNNLDPDAGGPNPDPGRGPNPGFAGFHRIGWMHVALDPVLQFRRFADPNGYIFCLQSNLSIASDDRFLQWDATLLLQAAH
ncbi:hypothetical protein V1509DRAFT_629713 [Lipomyces kononenkoae]